MGSSLTTFSRLLGQNNSSINWKRWRFICFRYAGPPWTTPMIFLGISQCTRVPPFVPVWGGYPRLFRNLPRCPPRCDRGQKMVYPLSVPEDALGPFLLVHCIFMYLLLSPWRPKIRAQIPHAPWLSTGERLPVVARMLYHLTGPRCACTHHPGQPF